MCTSWPLYGDLEDQERQFGLPHAEYGAVAKPSCATYYVSFDHLGSVRMLTDGSGNVVARQDYLPFGEKTPADTAGAPRVCCLGQARAWSRSSRGRSEIARLGWTFLLRGIMDRLWDGLRHPIPRTRERICWIRSRGMRMHM